MNYNVDKKLFFSFTFYLSFTLPLALSCCTLSSSKVASCVTEYVPLSLGNTVIISRPTITLQLYDFILHTTRNISFHFTWSIHTVHHKYITVHKGVSEQSYYTTLDYSKCNRTPQLNIIHMWGRLGLTKAGRSCRVLHGLAFWLTVGICRFLQEVAKYADRATSWRLNVMHPHLTLVL